VYIYRKEFLHRFNNMFDELAKIRVKIYHCINNIIYCILSHYTFTHNTHTHAHTHTPHTHTHILHTYIYWKYIYLTSIKSLTRIEDQELIKNQEQIKSNDLILNSLTFFWFCGSYTSSLQYFFLFLKSAKSIWKEWFCWNI